MSGDDVLIEKGEGEACGRVLQLDYAARHGGIHHDLFPLHIVICFLCMLMWRLLRRSEYAGSARSAYVSRVPAPLTRCSVPGAARLEVAMPPHKRHGQVSRLARTLCPRPGKANVPAAVAREPVINPRAR